MLHPYLITYGIRFFYIYLTVIYPIKQTIAALKKKAFCSSWNKVLVYWFIYMSFFITELLLTEEIIRNNWYKLFKMIFLVSIIRHEDSKILRICMSFIRLINRFIGNPLFELYGKLYFSCGNNILSG